MKRWSHSYPIKKRQRYDVYCLLSHECTLRHAVTADLSVNNTMYMYDNNIHNLVIQIMLYWQNSITMHIITPSWYIRGIPRESPEICKHKTIK